MANVVTNDMSIVIGGGAGRVELHLDQIAEGGAVIFPDKFEIDPEPLKKRGVRVDALPLTRIAEEHGNRVMTNTAALGAAAGITEFPIEFMESVIRDNFAAKGQQVVDANLRVADAAYKLARERYGADFRFKLAPVKGAPRRLLMNGNEALAMGALARGG